MNDSNLSLLTQQEIDTLVKFLVEKKDTVKSNVLNQESIDKLILLIRNNEMNKLNLNSQDSITDDSPGNLSKLGIQDSENQLCELTFRTNATTGYLEFYAINTVTGKEQKITPSTYNKAELSDEETEWGYSVAPFVLAKISSVFNLKYTKETYDAIYKLYALKNFGSENAKLYDVFIPDSLQLVTHLI